MTCSVIEVGTFLKERQERFKPEEANLLNLKRIQKIDFAGIIHTSEPTVTKTDMILIKKGDLVVSGINAEKGAIGVYKEEGDALATIHYSSYYFDESRIDIEYFIWFLRSNQFKKLLVEESVNGIKTEIKSKKFLTLKISLPDLTTQKYIAKKLKSISLDYYRLQDILIQNEKLVYDLRKTILQIAVQGKLLKQNPDDEPANALYEKIEIENKKLLKKGKIQSEKKLKPVNEEEIPYCIPKEWLWTRFGNIAPYIEAGWSPMCEKRPKEGNEWGVLKISAVSWNVFKPSENKALPSDLNPKPEYEVKPDDFLMSRANTSELVGKSVIVENTPPNLMLNDKVLRLFFSSFVHKKFYNIFNNCPVARLYYAKKASGTSSSMKNISREVIYNMPVPLPPLAEQKRIVEKVEQLMFLCDELEAKLRKELEDSEKLMEAAVNGLLKDHSSNNLSDESIAPFYKVTVGV